MPRVIDISVALEQPLPSWPGSSGHRTRRSMSIEAGDLANVTALQMDVHAGTHVENSLHFLADGEPLSAVALERLIGPALVVAVKGPTITPQLLDQAQVPLGTSRLLLKTSNSALWHAADPSFRTDYVALTRDAAAWLVERGIDVVGIDYLSIQRYGDDPETHRTLMRAGVAIIEGLDLSEVEPGPYQLVCLPLRLANAEAAPARVILMEPEQPE
ncbi:MAG: cyclase family protein [Chloroflexota bacterium]|nr:cyclase family protein [Chloroflexota bacterium]